ncbi:MAG: tRNA lysidine(34) synthetase TilS [Casimicrobiaceae bacterium]
MHEHAVRGEATVDAVNAAVAAALSGFVAPGAQVAVALSGGIDSMALLDALAIAATRHDFALSAIHVNHGLSPNARAWSLFCAEQCAARALPLVVHELRLAHASGASLEAQARAARYACLDTAAVNIVALAHHADDQAETVLLQLLRGAGPRGLAAMPAFRPGRPALMRPLLALTRLAIAAYAQARHLEWIDDESNDDTRFKRNLLRHSIAPVVAAQFPGYPHTLVRAAAHQAEASELIDALAQHDAATAIDPIGLDRARLAQLSPARGRNLLRWYLRSQGLKAPSEARLAELLHQVCAGAADACTRIVHDGAEIGCHRGRAIVHAPTPAPFRSEWHGDAEVRLPGGLLRFARARGTGIAAAKLAQRQVSLRSRSGGERIQLVANRPRRALKKMLQDAGFPAWQRAAVPLVFCGEELAAVPGLGVELTFQSRDDEYGWMVVWQPDRHRSFRKD